MQSVSPTSIPSVIPSSTPSTTPTIYPSCSVDKFLGKTYFVPFSSFLGDYCLRIELFDTGLLSADKNNPNCNNSFTENAVFSNYDKISGNKVFFKGNSESLGWTSHIAMKENPSADNVELNLLKLESSNKLFEFDMFFSSCTVAPTFMPSTMPTDVPTSFPTNMPSVKPSSVPSVFPISTPSVLPSVNQSLMSSSLPTAAFSNMPSIIMSSFPSRSPTLSPFATPSIFPTLSSQPTLKPSSIPSISPDCGIDEVSGKRYFFRAFYFCFVLEMIPNGAFGLVRSGSKECSINSLTSSNMIPISNLKNYTDGIAYFEGLWSGEVFFKEDKDLSTVDRSLILRSLDDMFFELETSYSGEGTMHTIMAWRVP